MPTHTHRVSMGFMPTVLIDWTRHDISSHTLLASGKAACFATQPYIAVIQYILRAEPATTSLWGETQCNRGDTACTPLRHTVTLDSINAIQKQPFGCKIAKKEKRKTRQYCTASIDRLPFLSSFPLETSCSTVFFQATKCTFLHLPMYPNSSALRREVGRNTLTQE